MFLFSLLTKFSLFLVRNMQKFLFTNSTTMTTTNPMRKKIAHFSYYEWLLHDYANWEHTLSIRLQGWIILLSLVKVDKFGTYIKYFHIASDQIIQPNNFPLIDTSLIITLSNPKKVSHSRRRYDFIIILKEDINSTEFTKNHKSSYLVYWSPQTHYYEASITLLCWECCL